MEMESQLIMPQDFTNGLLRLVARSNLIDCDLIKSFIYFVNYRSNGLDNSFRD